MTVETGPRATAAADRVRRAATAVATLVRETPDLGTRVVGDEWTVADVAAHLVCVVRCLGDSLSGSGQRWAGIVPAIDDFRRRLAGANAAGIASVPKGDAGHLADLITDGTGPLLEAIEASNPVTPCDTPWYGPGVTAPAESLVGIALAELTIHGHDIAVATRRPWPIDPDIARAIARTVFPALLPHALDRTRCGDLVASYEIRIRGGEAFVVHLDRGRLTVTHGRAKGRVDVHLSADPVAFFLVAYGRASQWPAIGRGALFAWGRRPWLAFSFRGFFQDP
ncbi:MAG TPA: maleylpyruvate isomerase N-terminal domain-containing protein [Candidatus Dormibacteraeota bacterium]|nr:maleylpyruvate isomerase N-terminal domain-containing protein [Candidatus Dormibacteraeota bacterium]